MNNRFGFRDFITAGLMITLIVVCILAMVQYDRQFDKVQAIEGQLREQGGTLRELARTIEQGVRVTGSTGNGGTPTGSAQPLPPNQQRIVAAQEMPDYAQGDWYVTAFGVEVGKTTPYISGDVYASLVNDYIFETLLTRDPVTLDLVPRLAESWEVSDDGLLIIFRLREDVTFSDGEPFTAQDVVFTYNWVMNEDVAAPRVRSYLDKIEQVTALGTHQVAFRLKEYYFQAVEICGGLEILAEHYYSQFSPDEYNKLPGLSFGSGPYKLRGDPRTWAPGSDRIELVRNEEYWGAWPAFDRIVFRIITDPTAQLVAFRNGEIDAYSPRPEQYVKVKSDAQLLKKANLYEYETVTGGYRYLGWNQKRGGKPTPFADRRVRQAMTLLTNREELARTLMVGLATPNSGPFHRLGNQANPDIEPWPYNPDAAIALLKEAGYEDRDGDGVIESEAGVPFEFRMIYPSSSPNYRDMAAYLRDAYKRAGISMEPDPLEWTIMLQRMDARDFDAMTLGWGGTIESDPNQIFHSRSIGDGGDNYVSYVNEEVDQLIDQARVTQDPDERNALWGQVHTLLHEDQPYTFLWTSRAVRFVDKRIRNVQLLKLGLSSENEWFVPVQEQRYGQ